MDREDFRLDRNAKSKINGEFARQDDTSRVNAPRKRPAGQTRPQQGVQPHRPVQPRRPAQPGQGQYPPYPPKSGQPAASRPAQGQPQAKRRPRPGQGSVPPRQGGQHQPYPTQQVQQPKRRAVRKPKSRYVQPEPVYQPEYIPEYQPGPLPEKSKKHRLGKLLFRIALFCVVVIILNIIFFYYSGEMWFNEPRKRDYPVRGAVVSEDLGKIDWEKFAGQSMSFVYIRATRGTAEIDEQYKTNRRGANNTDLLCGYWHEFDFRVDGKAQAENYIKQVGDLDGKLTPMVRVTRYGIYRILPKDEQKAAKELRAFIDRIKEEYDADCIIQCDSDCYDRYVAGEFPDDPLWLISHFSEPDADSMGWTLWEYNPRVRTVGYSNKKKYYCMSVCQKGRKLSSFENEFLLLYEDEEEYNDEGYYDEEYYY